MLVTLLNSAPGGGIPTAPAFTSNPVVSGIATQGQTLTTTNGVVTGFPGPTLTYQWTRDGSNIAAATAQTYVQVLADVGHAIGSTVTATNATPPPASANSNTVTTAALLTISGSPATTGTVGAAYSFTPTAAGGHTAYTFSISPAPSGPSGLSFSTSTGALTASALGPVATYGPFTIKVTDHDGLTASLAPFSIAVSSGAVTFSFPISLEYMGY